MFANSFRAKRLAVQAFIKLKLVRDVQLKPDYDAYRRPLMFVLIMDPNEVINFHLLAFNNFPSLDRESFLKLELA